MIECRRIFQEFQGIWNIPLYSDKDHIFQEGDQKLKKNHPTCIDIEKFKLFPPKNIMNLK